jgi:hypothetical protein
MKATLVKRDQSKKDAYYINATWRIDQDKMNYILQRKSGQKWVTQGYYQTLAQLYHAFVEFGIKERSLADMKGLMDRVAELHSLIENNASSMKGVKHGI